MRRGDHARFDVARARRVLGADRETLASALTELLFDAGFRVVVVKV